MDEVITDVYALTVRELQHELRKRGLKITGIKKDLRKRVINALRSEYADGWTTGHLLNVKIVPFNGRGQDPRTLIGRHVTSLREGEDNTMDIMLSDGEDQKIVCQASDTDDLGFVVGKQLFDLFDTSSNELRTYEKRPLLVADAVTALCKDDQGVVAATIFGIKLAGMEKIAFLGVVDKEKSDVVGLAELGIDAWLAGDGEARLGNDSLMIMQEVVGNTSVNPLLGQNDKPIKTDETTDGIGNGWFWQWQAGKEYPRNP